VHIRTTSGAHLRTPQRPLRGEAAMPNPDPLSPVSFVPGDDQRPIEDGIAVCLSGGGYRAMLFHTGVLWRLLEFGLLSPGDRTAQRPDGTSLAVGTFRRISSVSGGSIISAMLGHKWKSLDFTSSATLVATYQSAVVRPIRNLAGETLASGSLEGGIKVLTDIVAPGSVNEHLARAYDKHLYRKSRLNELPAEPRWVINAANLQSGALWRFMAPYMRDWKVGENRHTDQVSIAAAVAASSAFPPVLAPATFEFEDGDFTPNSGGKGADNLQRPPYTTEVQLADGGVYDNLGLETAYKRYRTLFVSDAGAPFKPDKDVPTNWAGLGKRVIDVVDNQVRALRKRLLLNALVTGTRRGAYWDIDADIARLTAPGTLPCPHAQTLRLAGLGTDLGEKDDRTQERLINWGYALCDASVRTWFDTSLPPPGGFPYPGSAV
jgi:NTE family protein